MSKKITVILSRANWCGHCQHFEPIYEIASKSWKENKYLKDLDLEFKNYDMAKEDEKNIFMLEHINAMDKVKGYPTVLIKDKSGNYVSIDHTVVDNGINEKDQHNEASERFLTNISNALKSKNSDGKVLYVQSGGFHKNNDYSIEESEYKKKYLKYKSKYMELKNKI